MGRLFYCIILSDKPHPLHLQLSVTLATYACHNYYKHQAAG